MDPIRERELMLTRRQLFGRSATGMGTVALAAHANYGKLHQFRLQAKRFRYTLELYERFYESEMASGAEILKELGAHVRLIIPQCLGAVEMLREVGLPVPPIAQ